MKRINELIMDIGRKYPNDGFFLDFDSISPLEKKHFLSYDRALMVLDNKSWLVLKGKAVKYYMNHREGNKKQGFFNQLNEAFAYRYLIGKGFKDVRFRKEGSGPRE